MSHPIANEGLDRVYARDLDDEMRDDGRDELDRRAFRLSSSPGLRFSAANPDGTPAGQDPFATGPSWLKGDEPGGPLRSMAEIARAGERTPPVRVTRAIKPTRRRPAKFASLIREAHQLLKQATRTAYPTITDEVVMCESRLSSLVERLGRDGF